MPEAHRTAVLASYYQEYLADQNPGRFVRRVKDKYFRGALERLAMSPCRDTRRAACFALSFIGDYDSNPCLGQALADDDRGVRLQAESAIRNVWQKVGSEAYRQKLGMVMRLNGAQHFYEASQRATELIELSPDVAEGWNQRAIAYYSTGRYTEAIRDCQQTLEINPYHFDAAAGMGQCYLQLGDQSAAVDCLRRALKLNPGLEGVRAGIEYLTRCRRSS